MAQLKYESAIVCFMYFMQYIRLDIAFVVSKLSRFTRKTSVEHSKAIGRVFSYLLKTKRLGLQYSKFPAVLEGYTDESWISNVENNVSTTG